MVFIIMALSVSTTCFEDNFYSSRMGVGEGTWQLLWLVVENHVPIVVVHTLLLLVTHTER